MTRYLKRVQILSPGGAGDHLPGHFGISYKPWLRNKVKMRK